MENSGQFLFENDTKQWFVALGERWQGPLSASDVYTKILSRELSWAHFVWKKGQTGWKRACDVKPFQSLVPQAPASAIRKEVLSSQVSKKTQNIKAPPPPSPIKEQKIWFLYKNETQYGPFSKKEIQTFLQSGKINLSTYAWKEGLENWIEIKLITEFNPSSFSTPQMIPKSPAKVKDKRSTPRRPLVAKIFISNNKEVSVGVCQDLSIGGMQVLMSEIPGSIGTHVKINVSPSGNHSITPFVAEGIITRILEDERGFSFRFTKMTATTQKSIETYLES